MQYLRAALLALLLLVASGGARGAPACRHDARTQPGMVHLGTALRQDRFVAYEPTGLTVVNGAFSPASAADIRADLQVLRRRFDALITYDAVHGAQQIAPIARQLKFHAIIIGVWNPAVAGELDAALATASRFPDLVAGISLGNETLFFGRTDPKALARQLAAAHVRVPAVPLTTTEPFHMFTRPETAALLPQLDFLLANVHPVFQPWFRSGSEASAAQFVVNVVNDLAALGCGPVLVKETGEPSGPASAGFTPERQAAFYRELRGRFPPSDTRAFAYFAAFDAPWRENDAGAPGVHPEEAHWGLFDAARRPKAAAAELPALPAR